jgi:hypothetical protein
MHQEGWALGGKFSGKNFHIYVDESMKLDSLVDVVVMVYNDEDLDDRQYVYMIKENVFLGQTLPFDLTKWIKLISQGVKAFNRNLLSNHVDMMEPYQAYGRFVCMYQIISIMGDYTIQIIRNSTKSKIDEDKYLNSRTITDY